MLEPLTRSTRRNAAATAIVQISIWGVGLLDRSRFCGFSAPEPVLRTDAAER